MNTILANLKKYPLNGSITCWPSRDAELIIALNDLVNRGLLTRETKHCEAGLYIVYRVLK